MQDKTWNMNLVGVLPNEVEVLEDNGKNTIFLNKQNSIQFYIKVISEKPYNYPDSLPYVTCFTDELEPWGFRDDVLATEQERLDRVRSFLHDNLLIFKLRHKVRDFKEYYVASDIHLMAKLPSFNSQLKLFTIPIFSEASNKITNEEFLTRLQHRKYVGTNEQISKEEFDTPTFILWEDEGGEMTVLGEFDNHTYAHGGFRFLPIDVIRHIPFKEKWQDESYKHRQVMFVPENIIYGDIDVSLQNGDPFDIAEEPADTKSEAEQQESSMKKELDREASFMKDFIEVTRDEGLFYHEKDLYNFHTAVKTGSLVILAGMSGTGKSKLVQAYAKTLGLGNQYSLIPVRPSWTDDSDLIGYADTLNMVYRPGDSGLVNTLIKAENEPDKLFLICFDEMNLARVEHYFSQFLSVLEMDEGKRVLRLYNDELTNRFYNGSQYKPTLTIGDNVVFVGTVNIDESTHHFSDKVLDRANLISLSVLPFNYLFDIEEKKRNDKRDPVSKDIYNSFKNQQRPLALTEREVDFLWAIHEEIQIAKQSMGIGPRIIRQIDRYLKNLPIQGSLSRKEAFDLQLVQRIWTKLRGPEELLSELVGEYRLDDKQLENSKLLEIVSDFPDLSDFTVTKRVMLEKAKELRLNGYTI
ncbi:McrB family protein [Peribacillus frigoritolerans]|uniref:McrB family protein n=1 Tax=Peribacillus frigoritolerans TaxID=450367 RepID=UPI003F81014B